MISRMMIALSLCWLALPAVAEGWRSVDLGSLTFEVPETWQFAYDSGSQAGGFAEDEAGLGMRGLSVVVGPGPLAAKLGDVAVRKKRPIEMQGLTATEIVPATPIQPDFSIRFFDIDTPNGTAGLVLSAPEADTAAWEDVFSHLLASVRVKPGQPDPIADPSGGWFVDGNADSALTMTAQGRGQSFLLSGEGVEMVVTRRDPATLEIILEDGFTRGVFNADNTQVAWDDGSVWTRQPGTVDGEPMSLAGVSVPMTLGQVEVWVPALWQQSLEADALGQPFAVASDPKGEAVARLVVLPGTGDAAMFDALANQTTAGVKGGVTEPQTPWAFAYDASGKMDLPTGSRSAQLRLRAVPVAGGMAVLLVLWAEDGSPLTQDDASQILYGATVGELGGPVVATSTSVPKGALFTGTLTPDWQPVASAGGDFDRFAQVADGALVVDVSGGAGWGKAGIWSTRPLITFDGPHDTVALGLRLDPDRTTNFALSLDPRSEVEEWNAHDVRLHWVTSADGSTSHAALFVRQRQVAALDLPGGAPEFLELRLDTAGTVRLLLPDGQSLEAQMPLPMPVDGFFLHIVSHSAEAEGPARLALTAVTLAHGAPAAASISPYPQSKTGQVLFDTSRGRIWAPLVLAGGDFARDARIDAAGLTVSVDSGLGWAAAGLYTPRPALWLEDFHDDAAVTLDWIIDPTRSEGFVLAMARTDAGDYPGEPPAPALIFAFIPDPAAGTGRASLRLNNDLPGEAWSSEGPVAAPSRVKMVLRPGEVTVEAEGFAPVTLPWSQAVEGAGLHLYGYAIAPVADVAHRWALTRVEVSHTAATVARPEMHAAEGVVALPMTRLFDGALAPTWEAAAVSGGSYDAFARMQDGRLSVNVPAGNSWAMTGLLSSEPVLRLDQRNAITPARLDVLLDPKAEPAFNLALSLSKTPDMWPDHVVWFTLLRMPGREIWEMTLHYSAYLVWKREIDAAWMDAHWDGRVQIDVGLGWASIALPGGPILRGEVPTMPQNALYATVMAIAPNENLSARLDLLDLQSGLETPPGLTAADRWTLLDDSDFVPEAYLNDIASDLEILP